MKGMFKMYNCEFNVTIDPKDKYEKAKKDMIQAMNSIRDLDMQQRQQLLYELVGIEQFNMFIKLYQQFICQK